MDVGSCLKENTMQRYRFVAAEEVVLLLLIVFLVHWTRRVTMHLVLLAQLQ